MMRNGADGTSYSIRLVLGIVCLWACDGAEPDNRGSTSAQLLISDLVLGADLEAPPELQFVGIQDLLSFDDGSFWIIDGFDERDASIRRYDASGVFQEYVSGAGEGPGDFMHPLGLAQLYDSRVVVTDQLFPQRLSLFNRDGTLNAVVPVPDGYWVGPSGATFVDDTDLIWRSSVLTPRPGPNRGPGFWTRIQSDGTVVDTVHLPQLPDLNTERLAYVSPDGRITRGFSLPYRPSAHRAVTYSGHFLVAPGDEYRVYRLDRNEGGEGTMELFISRDVPRVPVSQPERMALKEAVEANIADFARERDLSLNLEVPDVAAEKPFIRGLVPLKHGGTMVWVSMPSVQRSSGWVEPNGYDVFDKNGRFRGRVVLPDGHRFLHARGGNIWSVFTDELGVESVHRFPLPF